MLLRVLLLLLLFSASRAGAQTITSGAQYVSATQLRDTVAGAARGPAGMAGVLLGNRGAYTYLAIRRDRSGEVEVHAAWDDVIVVQEGTGTVLFGGRVSGDRETAPGERRGGQVSGGSTRVLAAGDVMVIPAGMPHQVQVPPGGSITYFVVKASSAGSSPPRTGG